MDPINPWLDPIEVRRMADRLMRPDRTPQMSSTEAGFGVNFEGFAGSVPVTPPPAAAGPQAPPPARQIEPTPPPRPEPVPEPAPVPPPAESPDSTRGPFLERIRAFRSWMHSRFGASGMFILDREGAVIFDESNHGRLHFLARSLALASRRQGSSTGNVHVKIGAGATLEVIPVETPYGCLVLGAVVPEALDAGSVATVMEALGRAASPTRT